MRFANIHSLDCDLSDRNESYSSESVVRFANIHSLDCDLSVKPLRTKVLGLRKKII